MNLTSLNRLFLSVGIFLVILTLGIPPAAAAANANIQLYIEPSTAVATACVDNHCQLTSMFPEGEGATFSGLDSNSYHTVTVTLDGYQRYYQSVYLTAGTQVIDAVLQPVPTPTPVATGNLEIEENPKGGTACIDGTQCQTLPFDPNAGGVFDFTGLSGNTYHYLTINLNGYKPYAESILVDAGGNDEEAVTLLAVAPTPNVPTTGQLTVHSTPPGAGVYLDNGYKGITPIILMNIPAGSHTVMFQMNGYQELSTEVTVVAGGSVDVPGTLIAGSPAPAAAMQPTPTPKSGLGMVPVLGALVLCGALVLFRKNGN